MATGHDCRRVFVSRLAPYTKKEHLLKVFEPFGPVHAVVRRKNTGNVAFVTFATPEQADLVVEAAAAQPIRCHKRKLKVSLGDSWHEAVLIPRNTEPANPPSPDPFAGLTIRPWGAPMLPEECVAMIAAMLPYPDRAGMERVSRLWRRASVASHRGTTAVNLEDWRWDNAWSRRPISTEAFYWMLRRCGRYVSHITLDERSLSGSLKPQVLAIACEGCVNLSSVDLKSVTIRPSALRALKGKLTLKSLSLGKCEGPVDQYLSEVTSGLRYLSLQENTFTGKSLEKGFELETLEIKNCENLRDACISSALASCSGLSKLLMTRCPGLRSPGVLTALTGNTRVSETLECLTFGTVNFDQSPLIGETEEFEMIFLTPELIVSAVNFITHYKNITSLSVALCRWVDGNVVQAMGAHMKSLKRLNVSSCMSIRGADLAPLGELTQCEELFMNHMYSDIEATFLARLDSLKRLDARDNLGVTDLDICGFLEHAIDVELINVEGCNRITRTTVLSAENTIPIRRHKLYLYLGQTQAYHVKRGRKNTYLTITYDRITPRAYFVVNDP